jgi:hypothetical protein
MRFSLPSRKLSLEVTKSARGSHQMDGWSWELARRTWAPAAAVGGTIALVKNGDLITLDADKGLIQLEVTSEKIKRWRAAWKPRSPRYKGGVLAEYAAHVSSASEGAVLRGSPASRSDIGSGRGGNDWRSGPRRPRWITSYGTHLLDTLRN